MPSPEVIAASQSERTEAEARAVVKWEDLQKLAAAYMNAKQAHMIAQFSDASTPLTVDDQINHDIRLEQIRQRFYDTSAAYQSALKRYQEQQS